MWSMKPRMLLLTTVLAAAATPAAAQAATLTLDKPCVRPEQPVGFNGAGFAPGAMGSLTDNGNFVDTVNFDAAGGAALQFGAPGVGDTHRESHTLSLTDGAGATATAAYQVTDLRGSVAPKTGTAAKKVAYSVAGFVNGVGQTLYAHYTYAGNQARHVHKKTVALGRLSGPCGDLKTAKRFANVPVKKARKGVWVIQLDTSKTFKYQQGDYVEVSAFITK